MKFFEGLVNNNVIGQYASFLDWIVSEEKFQPTFIAGQGEEDKELWNPNRVSALTKAVRKIDRFSENRFTRDARKRLTFPKRGDHNTQETMTFYIAKGDSECKDLIRHIRNGIAHGHAEILKKNGELVVELLDFADEKTQTAYMLIPLSFLLALQHTYLECEAKWKRRAYERKQKGKKAGTQEDQAA